MTSEAASSQHQFRELEGLRALAALAVLLTHAGFLSGAVARDILPGFLARMDIGVAVFFVLSGFLLYRPYAAHLRRGTPSPSLRTYAIRRTARLVPAWLVVLLGALVLVPESRTAPQSAWVANLLQVQSLRIDWDLPGLTQLWSLSTEVMFYVALPLVAAFVARVCADRGPRAQVLALLGLAAGTWVFRFVAAVGPLPFGWAWTRTLPGVGDWFVLGMVLAVVVSDASLRERVGVVVRATPLHLYALAALIFWLMTTLIGGPYTLAAPSGWQANVKHLGYAAVAGLLIAPSVLGARTFLSPVLRSRVLGYLGTISYGIFLWHLPLMFWIRDRLGFTIFDGHFWMTVVATTIASVVAAAASWHLLEAPIQRWARRRTTPRPEERQSEQRQTQQA